jgi:hypothetical protein
VFIGRKCHTDGSMNKLTQCYLTTWRNTEQNQGERTDQCWRPGEQRPSGVMNTVEQIDECWSFYFLLYFVYLDETGV